MRRLAHDGGCPGAIVTNTTYNGLSVSVLRLNGVMYLALSKNVVLATLKDHVRGQVFNYHIVDDKV